MLYLDPHTTQQAVNPSKLSQIPDEVRMLVFSTKRLYLLPVMYPLICTKRNKKRRRTVMVVLVVEREGISTESYQLSFNKLPLPLDRRAPL